MLAILSLLVACTDDFKNVEQNITPLDTSEVVEDTGLLDTGIPTDTSDTNDTDDTQDTNDTQSNEDVDGDGWTEADGDCDDTNANINPSVPDNNHDNIDQNCDGVADEGWQDPQTQDLDNDNYTPAEGDCADWDPSYNPGADDDECDGLDQNCDGVVDDGFQGGYEPNETWTIGDESAINYLGSINDASNETIEIQNYHSSDNDIDTFAFHDEDSFWTDFQLRITLYNISNSTPFPPDLTLELQGYHTDGTPNGVTASATGNGPGTNVQVEHEGTWDDDTGYYVITISGEGADCVHAYNLKIEEL